MTTKYHIHPSKEEYQELGKPDLLAGNSKAKLAENDN